MPAGRSLLATVATLLAGASIIACGGDSSADGEDFFADAESICIDATAKGVEAFVGSLDAPAEEANSTYLEGLAAARTAEIEQLEGLDPPQEESDAYRDYLDLRSEATDRLEQAAAAEADPTAIDRASGEAEALRSEADELGAELGFEACANQLPAADEEAIAETIEVSTNANRAEEICNELSTERFQNLFGGVQECIKAQAAGPSTGAPEVVDLKGVTMVSAEATVKIDGRGPGQPDTFVVDLLYEDDTWKLERIEPTA